MAEVNALAVDVFMKNLQEQCEGLFYMSESEYPLEPILWEVPTNTDLNNAEVLKLAGQPQDGPLEVVELTYFFRNHTAEMPDEDPFVQEMAQRFRQLQTYLLENLPEFKVYRIGQREIQVFGIGKLSVTQWAGFKTVSVET